MDERDIVRILFLAASPTNAGRLELDLENRTIKENIRRGRDRDHFKVENEWAVKDDDLQEFMNLYHPTIVHFSGHGTRTGELLLEGADRTLRPIQATALRSFMRDFTDSVRMVILNACYTYSIAEMLSKDVDAVIGMNYAVSDQAATEFISRFYQALSFGKSIQNSFDQGITQLQIKNIPEENNPRLFTRRGVNASKITWRDLIKPAGRTGAGSLAGKHSGAQDRPVSIFVSYASEDERIYERLDTHFAIMKRNGTISSVLRFNNILAGQSSVATVTEYLNAADIVLLLISPDFMASDNLYENELKPAFRRSAQGLTKVVPILVRPTTGWNEDKYLHGLWVLPTNKTPISRWNDVDSALLSVAQEVRRVIDTIKASQA